MREAMLYEKLPDNKVRCKLCAHRCVIADGESGICTCLISIDYLHLV
jgi:pyruvate formate lyase activating enzyme